jgi:hypothetical protein
MEEVTEAAARQGLSRSAYVVQVLRKVPSARKDAEISRRINELFQEPSIAEEQSATARAMSRRTARKGTEW